jgi:hypothetical protein
VPIRVGRPGRRWTYWTTPGTEELARYVASHPRFRQRDAARDLGLSLAKVERGLELFRKLALATVETVRGPSGYTSVRLQSDVRLRNVSGTEDVYLRPNLRLSVGDTFRSIDQVDRRTDGWLALRETLGRLVRR